MRLETDLGTNLINMMGTQTMGKSIRKPMIGAKERRGDKRGKKDKEK